MEPQILIPVDFAWSTFTLTGCEESGNTIVMSTGQTSATAVSPQIANATKSTAHYDRWRNITKVKYDWTHTGTITYHASNDGGTTWYPIDIENVVFELPHGLEGDSGGNYQKYYYDLRFKATLTRDSAGDTSPVLTSVVINHNYVNQ